MVSAVNKLLEQSSPDLDVLEKSLLTIEALATTPASMQAFAKYGTGTSRAGRLVAAFVIIAEG